MTLTDQRELNQKIHKGNLKQRHANIFPEDQKGEKKKSFFQSKQY